MPIAEYLAWQEYAEVEPWGSHYDDLRAGIVAAAVYNVNRDTKKCPNPFTALEFTPWNSLSDRVRSNEPILLEDAEAQSKLLDRMIFGNGG